MTGHVWNPLLSERCMAVNGCPREAGPSGFCAFHMEFLTGREQSPPGDFTRLCETMGTWEERPRQSRQSRRLTKGRYA